ncbi:NACHT domain-containing protein [Streptomyces guryensis]|uniref:NACHT domain-containing protein n=1 Tax=Streptomyces guryensis TaxID=2886947 RepID=A0A9Q3VNZ0_9ACTN|nr:NACHT domain-containing protein [Streptomyces guryensis]MCD9875162.1 NACHT domain-containing protein [Streptomyces guryensis]
MAGPDDESPEPEDKAKDQDQDQGGKSSGSHVTNKQSGIVYGPSVQARVIHELHLHPPAAPAPEQEQTPENKSGPQDAKADQDQADQLARAADKLAKAVGERWQREDERRKVSDPDTELLPVRWTTAGVDLMDRWENIRRTPYGKAEPLALDEHAGDIAETYGTLPAGRLVVLGEAGSGKTVLGLRLVLDLLESRRPGGPVPEIFSLGSWNPGSETLEKWLSSRLSRDTSGLDTDIAEGTPVAAALVENGLILPVLDGFDEIAENLRPDALEQLNAFSKPLILTSRTKPYADAKGGTRGLKRAAAIELTALTPEDSESFLILGSAPVAESDWNHVLSELRDRPRTPAGESLREALTTPLMVSLARGVYGEMAHTADSSRRDGPRRSPRDLLGFGSRASIEEHLLSSFVPSAYRRRPGDLAPPPRNWSARRAQRWLGYLADHLKSRGQPDLEWWRLGTELSLGVRTAVISFLAGLSFAVPTAIGNIPVDLIATSHGIGFAIRRGLVVGLLHGLVFGLLFGYVYRRADGTELLSPRPVQVRLTGGDRELDKEFFQEFFHKVVLGALVGFGLALAIVLVDRLLLPPLGLDDGLGGGLGAAALFPLTIGLSAGIALGLMTWLETPIDGKKSFDCVGLLRQNRENVSFHLLVWALVPGLVEGLGATFTETPLRSLQLGLVFGIEGAFSGGLGYGLCLTAWGQWVALARIWLPLTRRLPWRLVAFLEDACERDVLRRSGAVYQFRHVRLQDHLRNHGKAAPEPPRRQPRTPA